METHAKTRKYENMIFWLLTIPECELSDSMLLAKSKLNNDIEFIEYLEKELFDEIVELFEWNNQMALI